MARTKKKPPAAKGKGMDLVIMIGPPGKVPKGMKPPKPKRTGKGR